MSAIGEKIVALHRGINLLFVLLDAVIPYSPACISVILFILNAPVSFLLYVFLVPHNI